MLISALTRKPLRRRRRRRRRATKMAEAQDTRSLIPGKRGCDRGGAGPHLGFADFLGSPVTPSPSSTSPSSACTRPSSLSRRFCVQSHGPGTKAVFVLSQQTPICLVFNMRDSRPTEKLLQFTCETSLISFFSVLMFILSLLPNSSWCFNCIFSNS